MEYTIGTEVLNGWKIIRMIGEGSFGKVYEIQKDNYGVIIKSALKVIHIPQSKSEVDSIMYEGMDEKSVTSYFHGVVQDIVREITVMSELKGHPNIVNCEDYSVVEYQDTMGWDILIRMELLTPLQEYVKQHELTEKEVIKIGQDLCKALSLCQKKGLVHRDIKPANIFVNDVGEFKLGDFGIARSSDKTSGALSKKGTESYMAPEVYLGKNYDARADFYSVGLVLYNLMNNKRLPFMPDSGTVVRFEDRENAMRKRMNGETMVNPVNASQGFGNVILKMCVFNPEDRYQTADEMLCALNKIDENNVTASAVKEPKQKKVNNTNQEKPKKKRKTGIIIVSVVAFAFVLVGVFAIKYFTSPQYAVKGESEELYKKACQQMEDGEYEDAMKTLDEISKDWAKYDDAVDKRVEVAEKYKEKVIEEAEKYVSNGDYTSAISVLKVAVKKIGSDKDIMENLAEISKKEVLAEVAAYKETGEYGKAVQCINDNIDILGDDSEILVELSNCEQKYRDAVIAEAAETYKTSGYEAAIKKLQETYSVLKDDEKIASEIEKYENLAPKSFLELKAFYTDYDGGMDGNKRVLQVMTDKLGNTYENCLQYDYGDNDSRDIYVINKEYAKFCGTIFVPDTRSSNNDTWSYEDPFYFYVYGDGVLLYRSPKMTSKQYPVNFEVDIKGVEQLQICWHGGACTWDYELGLANAYLYK